MDTQQFWAIIERTKLRAGEQIYARISTLTDELKTLSSEELQGFHHRFVNAHRQVYRHDVWAAADIALSGLSDDSFECFRNWLISEGYDTFTAVTLNPDEIAKYNLRGVCGLLEQYGYVSSDLLSNEGIEAALPCTGEELPGDAIQEGEVAVRFPKLAAKFLA